MVKQRKNIPILYHFTTRGHCKSYQNINLSHTHIIYIIVGLVTLLLCKSKVFFTPKLAWVPWWPMTSRRVYRLIATPNFGPYPDDPGLPGEEWPQLWGHQCYSQHFLPRWVQHASPQSLDMAHSWANGRATVINSLQCVVYVGLLLGMICFAPRIGADKSWQNVVGFLLDHCLKPIQWTWDVFMRCPSVCPLNPYNLLVEMACCLFFFVLFNIDNIAHAIILPETHSETITIYFPSGCSPHPDNPSRSL